MSNTEKTVKDIRRKTRRKHSTEEKIRVALDDYSRCIISWRLTTTMSASDVTDTLEDALRATGLSEARVRHRPRLLSDNGPCYISGELKSWLKQQDNVTPADVFEGRRHKILDQRALVKARTMTQRKIHNLRLAG